MKRDEIRLRGRLRRAEVLLARWSRWYPPWPHRIPGTLSALAWQTAEFLQPTAPPPPTAPGTAPGEE